MPHTTHVHIQELHPTFGASISGVDFSQPISPSVFSEIFAAITKYGVLVFRKTNLTDTAHVSFAAQFGELDDIKPYIQAGRQNRLEFDELFDVSNLDSDGSILDPNTRKAQMNRGNNIFHVDSSFNPRRASYSLLRAHALPPPGTGGATEFADTRTAFSTLPPSLQSQLVEKDYIAAHSLWHSRKTASPIILSDLTPETLPMARHKLIQPHEPSGRMNLYLASHIHHLEGLGAVESDELLKGLREHAENPELVLRVEWENEGDLVIWDNTCVMHRAKSGSYEGKFVRDMRRATVHDGSSFAWGLNEKVDTRQGFP